MSRSSAQAWQSLVDRHDALRTSFCLEESDLPIQEVHERVDSEIDVWDWRRTTIEDGEHRLDAFLRTDRRRGFALDRPPLWRLNLFRMAHDDDRLVWTSHHALFDGRSRLRLLEEFCALYDARSTRDNAGTRAAPSLPRPRPLAGRSRLRVFAGLLERIVTRVPRSNPIARAPGGTGRHRARGSTSNRGRSPDEGADAGASETWRSSAMSR